MKRKFTFVFILLSFFSVACFAQHGKQNMEQMKQRIKDSLNLTDAQADSVEAITAEFQPRIKSIMKDQSLSQDEKKQKVKPIKKQMVARLKTFLTNDQIQRLGELEKEMKKKNPKKGQDTQEQDTSQS
jgi:hypothetical protein